MAPKPSIFDSLPYVKPATVRSGTGRPHGIEAIKHGLAQLNARDLPPTSKPSEKYAPDSAADDRWGKW